MLFASAISKSGNTFFTCAIALSAWSFKYASVPKVSLAIPETPTTNCQMGFEIRTKELSTVLRYISFPTAMAY